MRSTLAAILVLLSVTTSFAAALDCKQPSHAMDVAKCSFLEILASKSNADVELAKKQLSAQGFSNINIGEEPNAVFIRGDKNRYTYLVTTDVASKTGLEFKSIGMVISAKIDSQSSDREIRIEKIITSDSLQ